MNTAEVKLLRQIKRYKQWENKVPQELRFMEWQCDYDDWPDVYRAASQFLEVANFGHLEEKTLDALIFIIDADQWTGIIAHEVSKYPEKLIYLADRSLQKNFVNARSRFAEELSSFVSSNSEAEQILFTLTQDEDEYTRRMALKALAKANSPLIEQLVVPAWESGHEYQRMMVLFALQKTQSPNLEKYLTLAEEDGSEYLLGYTQEIRRSEELT